MALALAFLLFASGGTLIWSGVTDAEGGPIGLLGTILRGEETPKLKAPFQPTGGTGGGGGTGGNGGGEKVSPPPGGGGGGAAVVKAAVAELGEPYRWGAEGPDAFDCSGLLWWCIKAGGSKLGRTTAEGFRRQGKAVAAPAPGDGVFFGIPASHCGIYVGAGQMINAPNRLSVVRYDSVARLGPITYRRFV